MIVSRLNVTVAICQMMTESRDRGDMSNDDTVSRLNLTVTMSNDEF